MTEVEWSIEAAIRLLQEYQKRPELWDQNHSLYRVHTAKYEAWTDMARIFECDMMDLRKKLNSIFASHRREKAKVRAGERSTWFLYPHMAFLPNHVQNNEYSKVPKAYSKKSKKEREDTPEESEQATSEDEDNEHVQKVIIKAEPDEPRPKKRCVSKFSGKPRNMPLKRKLVTDVSRSTSQLDSKLIEALKLLKRSDLSRKKDECDSFGEYIATSLRKHDERTQSMIKQAINNILFEQEMKKYSGGQYTVVLTNMEENPLVLGDNETEK